MHGCFYWILFEFVGIVRHFGKLFDTTRQVICMCYAFFLADTPIRLLQNFPVSSFTLVKNYAHRITNTYSRIYWSHISINNRIIILKSMKLLEMHSFRSKWHSFNDTKKNENVWALHNHFFFCVAHVSEWLFMRIQQKLQWLFSVPLTQMQKYYSNVYVNAKAW